MKKLFAIIALCFVLFTLQAESFYIENYDISITVEENRVYRVTESIDMYYTSPSHGFYRDIPVNYDSGFRAILSNIDVNATWDEEENNDYISIKIGDADRLVDGRQHYTISYDYDLGADIYPDYDEFYFNIIGPEWNCNINNVSFNVDFPKPIDRNKIWLTFGEYGSTSQIKYSFDGSRSVSGSLSGLNNNQALTLRVEMDEGYFVGARVPKDYSALGLSITAISAIIVLIILIVLYKKYGVDKPIVIVPRFEPPEGLSPLAVGYIYDSSADDRDFSAMIFYWADKGYIKIEDDNKSFILHKVKDLDSAPDEEKILFNALFGSRDSLSTKEIASTNLGLILQNKVKPALVRRFSKGEQSLKAKKSERMSNLAAIIAIIFAIVSGIAINIGDMEFAVFCVFINIFYFAICSVLVWSASRKHEISTPLTILFAIIMIVMTLIVTAVTFSFAITVRCTPILVFISCAISSILIAVAAILSQLITKRSEYGQKIVEEILGYREFIEKVEIDQLKTLIDQDPEYYYHNLSYAIALGLEDKWSKKFENLFFTQASWYYSSNPILDYYFYTRMFRRFNSSYTSKLITSGFEGKSSGGSITFSGSSGFSGGGFGGGGGRSW